MPIVGGLVLVAFCFFSLARCQQKEIDLTGPGWTISDSKGRVHSVPATVPGQVHTDLLRNGVIDDPYSGWNDWLLEWIAYGTWVYSRSFTLMEDDILRTIWLKCDGLDTVATIKVNGKVVGAGNNMHRRYFFDITAAVDVGTNSIDITLESAANYSYRMAQEYPYPVQGGGDYFNFSSRNFVRKTQSDFGWDWGPSFVPAGIWQNISVVSFRDVYVSYLIPRGYYNSTEQSYVLQATACFMLPAAIPQDKARPVKATVFKPPGQTVVFSWVFFVHGEGEVCRMNSTKMNTNFVERNGFWWPNGMGATSTLENYTVKVDITYEGGIVSSVEETKKTGFTRIDLIKDPADDGGHMFFFQLTNNGVKYPIYSKGSNFIPMDAFVSRATPDVAYRLLQSAVNGNQNMIRIWGGGLYQPDWFYSLCDELGIMVWQEFMFADALYPRDKDFLENVRLEIRHQLRRLMHHPSIVLWSGNNENQGIAQGNTDTLRHILDYSVLYDGTIRTTVWEEDNTRPYWPSSPSNGVLVDDRERQLFIQLWGEVGDPKNGDVHRYDYDDYCTDVSKFPRPRFASEFGFQSYPSFRSLSQVSQPQDWSNTSPFMMHRQHHASGNQQLQTQMSMFFHLPKNENNTVEFMDFIYLSQVVQGICIRAEAEHYHRLLSEEGAFTRGTLYWQLNDIWQAQSWASVEWSGQWKILHYFMKQVYEPITVSSYLLDGSVSVYVVVDRSDIMLDYDLEVQLISWEKGETVRKFNKKNLHSEGFTGVEVWKEKLGVIFGFTSEKKGFLHITVTNSSSQQQQQVVAETWFYPANFTDVKLPEAKITASDFNQTADSGIMFTLTSDAVAPFVYVESMEYYGIFNDNGFLMMPGVKYSMSFVSWVTVELPTFVADLQIRSVWDTYNGV